MEWKQYELGELLLYEQPTAYLVQSENYNDNNPIPVLTAGKSFILGYTNETKGIFTQLPVIIFDDFTTATQYVNFPFKVKSSAMKILHINTDLVLPKFIYYVLQTIQFDHSTHKRYWIQQYSHIKVAIPEKNEQTRIVSRIEELFSELDAGVETLRKTQRQLETYRQAVLKEAFSEYRQRQSIESISSLVTSGSRGWAKYYSDEGARFVRITDLTRDKITLSDDKIQRVNIPNKAEGKRSLLFPNDLLISITADLGSIALVPNDIGEAYINQHIALVRLNNSAQSEFIAWYLKSDFGQKELLKNKRGAGKMGLGLDDIRKTLVPIVDDINAKKTVNIIDNKLSVCYNIEKTITTSLQQAEALRQSILKRAFEGKL